VIQALNFEQPDRIPVFDIVQNIPFIEHFAGEKIDSENGERVLCTALSRSIDLSAEINPPSDEETYESGGFVYKTEWWTTWLVKRPFDDVSGLEAFIKKNINDIENSDIESMWTYLGNYAFTGSDESNDALFRRQQSQCGDCMLVICESFPGLDTAYHLAGLELFSYLWYESPSLLTEWIEALAQHEIERIHRIANSELSPVTLVCCDIADKRSTIFSPEFLSINFFPQLKRVCEAWHEHDTKVIFHSDGNLISVIDDLIEAGIDGLNPLEPIEGIDVVSEICGRYPNLVLVGGVDAHHLLVHGTAAQVADEVKRLIDVVGPRGGFFVGSSIEMHPGCKLDNLIALVETTRQYGMSQ
jgi:uroporphyrinogen decarboxylase